jgi:short-subunit dehydrogenase
MPMDFAEKYGPWGIVLGGSDGIGAAFARALAARGINLVLVARREDVLEAFAKEVRGRYDVEVLTVPLDLARQDAMARLSAATAELEIGFLIANAGGDDYSAAFLDKDLDAHLPWSNATASASWRPRTDSADPWSRADAVALSW